MGLRQTIAIAAFALLWGGPAFADKGEADLAGFRDRVAPFFKTYCTGCHGPKKAKGKLTLHDIGGDLTTASDELKDRWQDILEQLTFEEMPPEKETIQPSARQRQGMIVWIQGQLKIAGRDP
ncbi:MAG: c-type cytochrome, partial [Phycisphaeraceae bacterium]|nr:c-type cytochrome [Phycisphaeraceae bacterium]